MFKQIIFTLFKGNHIRNDKNFFIYYSCGWYSYEWDAGIVSSNRNLRRRRNFARILFKGSRNLVGISPGQGIGSDMQRRVRGFSARDAERFSQKRDLN